MSASNLLHTAHPGPPQYRHTNDAGVQSSKLPVQESELSSRVRYVTAIPRATQYSDDLPTLSNHRPRQLHRSSSEISLGHYYGGPKSPFAPRPQIYRGVTTPPPDPRRPSARPENIGDGPSQLSLGQGTTDHPNSISYPTRVSSLARPSKGQNGSTSLKRLATDTRSRETRTLEEQRPLYRTTSRLGKDKASLNRPVKSHRRRVSRDVSGSSSYSWKSHLAPLPELADWVPVCAVRNSAIQSTIVHDDLVAGKDARSTVVPQPLLNATSTCSEGKRLHTKLMVNAGHLRGSSGLSKYTDDWGLQSMPYDGST
ncbi:hypothetical protein LTR34_010897 [Exophiala xenobiotica]|uniref:Uncharacterized protein n=1 Tax=Vermiconidia calcicola TaxID=1690605 RepID=A0AAV9PTI1_9PEZI|nr:hypothetical protein LTR34_010897 [Exophiala xenobiotica]KAK5527657.1 hypothetical protein LTR25_010980 [Vermiconidia calcicola]KAK5531535.1 hypothetical protein LTR23_009951 [Chaetothyriales sp. CCFEE 6169]